MNIITYPSKVVALRVFGLITFLFSCFSNVNAQFDTNYYLPPLLDTQNGSTNNPTELIITTAYPSSEVTLRTADGSINEVRTVNVGTPLRFPLSTVLGTTRLNNTIEGNKGLYIEATEPIQIVHVNDSPNNKTYTTLKGKTALGREFYAGSQTRLLPQQYGANDQHFISVMANEDNTEVTIQMPTGKDLEGIGNSVTVTLDQYETYLVRNANGTNVSNNIVGAYITSDKDIAVITGGQHLRQNIGGGAGDGGVDQLVPVSVLDTEYILTRGDTQGDYAVIIATQPNTNIFIDGNATAFATLANAGDFTNYDLPGTAGNNLGDPHFIRADKPIYVYHVSGLLSNEFGMGIAPSNLCRGSKSIEFLRFTGTGVVNSATVLLEATGQANFRFNGKSITDMGITPKAVPGMPGGTNWVSFSIPQNQFQTDVTMANTAFSPLAYYHLGLLVGRSGATGTFGFLSGFEKSVTLLDPVEALPTESYRVQPDCALRGVSFDFPLMIDKSCGTTTITNISTSQPGSTVSSAFIGTNTSTGVDEYTVTYTSGPNSTYITDDITITFESRISGVLQATDMGTVRMVIPPNIDEDGDTIPDCGDIDDDSDGIPDTLEFVGTNNPFGDNDGDGIQNFQDVVDDNTPDGDGSITDYTDLNSDGVPDVYDTDLDGRPNHLDLDSDNDGIPDNIEAQGSAASDYIEPTGMFETTGPNVGLDTAYSATGGLVTLPDSDAGTPSADMVPDFLDTDSDGDGFFDAEESGLSIPFNTMTGTVTGTVGNNGLIDTLDGGVDDFTDVNGAVLDASQTPDNELQNIQRPSTTELDYREIEGDNIDTAIEDAAPNDGDGNGDGIADSFQSTVGSIPDITGNTYVTVELTGGCDQLTAMSVLREIDVASLDLDFDYPLGLAEFSSACGTPGESVTVTFYWHGLSRFDFYRKYGRDGTNGTGILNHRDISAYDSGAITTGAKVIGGIAVPFSTFTITDDQIGDDNAIDAVITDPSGPAIQANGDADADNIANEDDLDDDNDGIPDIVECRLSEPSNADISPFATQLVVFEVPAADLQPGAANSVTSTVNLPSGPVTATITSSPSNTIDLEAIDASTRPSGEFFDFSSTRHGYRQRNAGPTTVDYEITYTFSRPIDVTFFDAESSELGEETSVTTNGGDWEVLDGSNLDAVDITFTNTGKTANFVPNGMNNGGPNPVALFLSAATTTITANINQVANGKIGIGVAAYILVCADNDGDGVANGFDIDSDNDGIPDVVEAQPSGGAVGDGTYTALPNNGIVGTDVQSGANEGIPNGFGAGIASPIDTDTDGIPDFLDTDADNDGISDTEEAGFAVATNTIDTDTDGLLDQYDASPTDPADGPYDIDDDQNTGANVFPNTQNPANAQVDYRDSTTDFDQDGVDDITDLDDDNDGILDTDEGECTTAANATFNLSNPFDVAELEVNGVMVTTVSNLSPDNATYRAFIAGTANGNINMDESDTNPLSNITFTFNREVILRFGSKIGAAGAFFESGEEITLSSPQARFTVSDPDDDLFNTDGQTAVNSIVFGGNNALNTNPSDDNWTIITSPLRSITITYENILFNNNGTRFNMAANCVFRDSDNDGVSDKFDTDSDNDGCADAIEAGHTDPDGDGVLGNSPVTVNSSNGQVTGQGGYTGITPEVTTAGPDLDADGVADSCDTTDDRTDTDNDGVPDVTDLDDDNDGILDTDENPSCTTRIVYPEYNANSPAGNLNNVRTAPATGNMIINPSQLMVGAGLTNVHDGFQTVFQFDGATGTTLSQAIANNDYVSFTFDTDTAVPSQLLTAFSENTRPRMALTPFLEFDHQLAILISDDGFATPGELLISGFNPSSTPDGFSFVSFQNNFFLRQNSSYEMRIYFYATAAEANNKVTFDDFILESNSCSESADVDNDGIVNSLDIDSDNDGIPDAVEAQPTNGINGETYIALPNNGVVGTNVQTTAGQEGIPNGLGSGITPQDTDGDGIPDFLDTNSDNDPFDDTVEAGFTPAINTIDTDGDGLLDAYDASPNEPTSGPFDVDDDQNTGAIALPNVQNPNLPQVDYRDPTTDRDNDRVHDAIDEDDDNDGITDVEECSGNAITINFSNVDGTTANPAIPSVENPNATLTATFTPNAGTSSASGDALGNIRLSSNVNGPDFNNGDRIVLQSDVPVYFIVRNMTANIAGFDNGSDGGDEIFMEATGGFLPENLNNEVVIQRQGGNEIVFRPNGNFNATSTTLWQITTRQPVTQLIIQAAGNPDTAVNIGILPDSDNDGIVNCFDIDSDNDGITDAVEAQPTDGVDGATYVALPNNGVVRGTDEGDVQPNGLPTGLGSGITPEDTDSDGIPDYLDTDSDNDTFNDTAEAGFTTATTAIDTDGDGLLDAYDAVSTGPNALDRDDEENGGAIDLPNDQNPNTPQVDFRDGTTDFDNDGIADIADLDDDNDGIPDTIESGGIDPSADPDNDGIPAYLDLDTDNNNTDDLVDSNGDGIPDVFDYDNDGVPNHFDLDGDNDGIYDVVETGNQANDANGDGRVDTDVEGVGTNGVPDLAEPTNDDVSSIPAAANTDGQGGANYLDIDSDDDGIPDNVEGQTTAEYEAPTGNDADGDGIDDQYDTDIGTNTGIIPVDTSNAAGDNLPDYLDTDSDDDGLGDAVEAGQNLNNSAGATDDTDGDGLLDIYDDNNTAAGTDFDVNDNLDNGAEDTPNLDNPSTPEVDFREVMDADGDGIADIADLDDDNDGIPDTVEAGINSIDGDEDGDGIPNYLDTTDDGGAGDGSTTNYTDLNSDGVPDVFDFDGDGIPNHLDLDADNDGIADIIEAGGTDADGDGEVDYPTPGDPSTMVDADNDGLADAIDTIDSGSGAGEVTNGTALPTPNSDTDSLADYLDLDADNDGIVDTIEAQSTSGYQPPTGTDSDNDGIDDRYDGDNSITVGIGGGTGIPITPVNTDGTDLADYRDTDSDNDGESDTVEAYDSNDDGVVDGTDTIGAAPNLANLGTDVDGDGLDDEFDTDTTVRDATNGGQTAANPFPDTDIVGGEPNWRENSQLTVTKTVDAATTPPYDTLNENITYTITVTNTGLTTINNIAIQDPNADSITPVLVSSLAPGASTTVTATHAITQEDLDAGGVENSASATGVDSDSLTISDVSDADQNADGTPVANNETMETPGLSATSPLSGLGNDGDPTNDPTVVLLTQQPELTFTKTAATPVDVNNNGVVDSNDTVEYTFSVQNTGNVSVTGATITDTRLGLTNQAVTPQDLAPTETGTFTVIYTIIQNDVDAGGIENTATVTATPPVQLDGTPSPDISDISDAGDETVETPGLDGSVDGDSTNDPTLTLIPTNPELTFSKTAATPIDVNGNGIVDTNDTVEYILRVQNTGNVSMTNVSVTDPKLGLTDAPITPTDLGPGDTGEIVVTYTITQTDVNAGGIENSATAAGTPPNLPDGTPATPITDVSDAGDETVETPGLDGSTDGDRTNDPTVTLIPASPELTFTKTAATPVDVNSNGIVDADDTVVYTFSIQNTGNVSLTGAMFTDTQLGLTDQIVSPQDLDPSDTGTFVFTYTITQDDVDAGGVENSATATAVPPNLPNGNPADPITDVSDTGDETVETPGLDGSTDGDPTNDPTLTVIPANSELTFTKTAATPVDVNNNGVIDADDTVEYTFSVQNTGNTTLSQVNIDDTRLSFMDALVSPSILAPGETGSITTVYTITQTDVNAGGIENSATATGTPPNLPDGTPATPITDVSDAGDETIETPGLDGSTDGDTTNDPTVTSIPKVASATFNKVDNPSPDGDYDTVGEVITYTLVFENTGNVSLTNVTVQDPNADTITPSDLGTVEPGDSVTVTATHVITQADIDAGEVINQATANATDPDSNTVSQVSNDPDTPALDDSTVTPIRQTSELTLTKVSDLPQDGSYDSIGEEITYTLEVTNSGTTTLQNVTVTDPNADAGSITPATIPVLNPGETQVVTAVHTITQADLDAGQVSNQAMVSGEDPNGISIDAISDDPTTPDMDDATIIFTGLDVNSAIEVTKSVDSAEFEQVGNVLTYTITVTNSGNVNLTNITVTDLNAEITSENPIAMLMPGESIDFTATRVITIDDILAGEVSNTATVEATNSRGDVLSEDSDDPADPTDEDKDNDGDPEDPTVSRLDSDNDGVPDVQDLDDDNDGITDAEEQNGDPNLDTDGDGIIDRFDLDADGDGVLDVYESGADTTGLTISPEGQIEGPFGTDGIPDGVQTPDTVDSGTVGYSVLDTDDDGRDNFQDTNDDDDDFDTVDEGPDPNGDGNPTDAIDTDRNGIPDFLEPNNADPTEEDGIEVFNGLTPNGDRNNDILVIRGLEQFDYNRIQIFNRWGVKVWETENYGQNGNVFRGVSNGRVTVSETNRLPVGTYYYVLEYRLPTGDVKTRAGYIYINK